MRYNFPLIIVVYTLGSMICLVLALLPLTYYIYEVFKNIQTVDFLYSPVVTLPLGVAFFWLIGFFIFITIHGRVMVRIVLPNIPEGSAPMLSNINKIYSLRLSADNIAKYWAKSLEWIPFLAQLVLYKQMLRAYGVKIGKNVYIATETRIDGVPLIEIGDDVFIGPRATIGAHINFKGGNIKYKKVKVGNGCFIGASSVLTPGCQIGDRSIVGGVTVLLLNTIVPPDETWVGQPGKFLKKN